MFGRSKTVTLPTPGEALPGRADATPIEAPHFVNGRSLVPPYPVECELAMFGMGCFWGAEKCFWRLAGVEITAVGYSAGYTPNPTYREVCSGRTGHNEVVLVVFDPLKVTYDELLRVFWESHDPSQGMRQGNDVGTQYRSGIYVYNENQRSCAVASRDRYQAALAAAGKSVPTTEILDAPVFYFAEAYHQQYLAKNPDGYCGLGGTGVKCPSPVNI